MLTLSALEFGSEGGAEQALRAVRSSAKTQSSTLQDLAIVVWHHDSVKPKTWQLADLTPSAAVSGAFWSMLFGFAFFLPCGPANAATFETRAGAMSEVGINDVFIKEVRARASKGTSCLFLMTSKTMRDRAIGAIESQEFEMVSTDFSNEHEEALKAAFANDA